MTSHFNLILILDKVQLNLPITYFIPPSNSYLITHHRSRSQHLLEVGLLTLSKIDRQASKVAHDLHNTGSMACMSVGKENLANVSLTLFDGAEKLVSIIAGIDEST